MEIQDGVMGGAQLKGKIIRSFKIAVRTVYTGPCPHKSLPKWACSPPPWLPAVVLSKGSMHTRGRHPKKPTDPSEWWAGGTGKEGGPMFIFSAREVFVFRVSPPLPSQGWECLSSL